MAERDYNLDYEFGADLREIPKSPQDVAMAVRDLLQEAQAECDPSARAKLFGEIGGLQRMLRDLPGAEGSLSESLQLLEYSGAPRPRIVAAKIRLAHVYQWQGRFAEADQLFGNAEDESRGFDDNGLLLSFALQHFGKSLFDQERFDEAIKRFYDAMMIRVRLKRDDLADSSRFALEHAVQMASPQVGPKTIDAVLKDSRTPAFIRHVLGKCHAKSDLPDERSNCINAALNFGAEPPYHFATASTLDLIQLLQKQFFQLDSQTKPQFGDALVYWSRSGGSWDSRPIDVSKINLQNRDFPYGLVFEHIAIAVSDNVAFHKPSPARDVPYKLDYFAALEITLRHSQGFERTLHRRRAAMTVDTTSRKTDG